MSLGSGFPAGYLRDQIVRRLCPGAVIKLARRMDDGKIHEKRHVVIHVDNSIVTCVINSEIGGFIRNRPALLRCQVQISSASHAFMAHDSHIDCGRPRSYQTDEVIRDLMARPDWLLGEIGPDLRNDIIAALKDAPTVASTDLAAFTRSLLGS